MTSTGLCSYNEDGIIATIRGQSQKKIIYSASHHTSSKMKNGIESLTKTVMRISQIWRLD